MWALEREPHTAPTGRSSFRRALARVLRADDSGGAGGLKVLQGGMQCGRVFSPTDVLSVDLGVIGSNRGIYACTLVGL